MNISIVTVSFNARPTIGDTMKSIHAQSFEPIEHLIIDGGSSDGTLATVVKLLEDGCFESSIPDIPDIEHTHLDFSVTWGSKSVRVISEPDDGLYDAMNKGIGLASGNIIGILNADDFYPSEQVIANVIKTFEETGCDAVYGNLQFVDEHDSKKVVRSWTSSPYVSGSFRKGWHPPHPTFFVKREIYERYGVFDTDFNISADFELMLRLIEKHHIKVAFLDEVLVHMRYGGESTGSLSKIIEGNRNVMRAFKKNGIPVSPFYPVVRWLPKLKQFFIR